LRRRKNQLSPAKSPLKGAPKGRKRAKKDPLEEEWIRHWEPPKKEERNDR